MLFFYYYIYDLEDSLSATTRSSSSHILSSSHDLINKKQLLSKSGSNVQPLFFSNVVIPDSESDWRADLGLR